MNDLSIVVNSLRSRRLSTVVTAGSVAVATALLLTMLSLRTASFEAFQRGTGTTHLLVSADSSPLTAVLNGVFYANAPSNPISWSKYQEIKGAFPYDWAIPTQQGDSFKGFPTAAVGPEFFTRFEPVRGEPWKLAAGHFPSKTFEVCLGSAAAAGTGIQVGQKIVLTHGTGSSRETEHAHEHDEFPFEVVGILEPSGSAHDRAVFINLESTWILHAQERREHEGIEGVATAADLKDEDRKITGILLRLPTRPGHDASAAVQQQFDALRRDTSIVVAQPAQQIDRLRSIVGNVDELFIALGAAVLVSSGISILLAMHNSMAERRRQIALLRALGVARSRITGMILTEATLIGFAGALAGALLSLAGNAIASGALKARIGLVVDPSLDPRSTLIILAGAILLSALAGVLPAMNAYRTSVAENLRPEA
ncbi:MAG: ABC transporter permease [Planctomycetes bacterium]|nr:ABC transporter permease [Planctomycetota bacterium]